MIVWMNYVKYLAVLETNFDNSLTVLERKRQLVIGFSMFITNSWYHH
jgi:hypothetical protein